eukprot:766475-Hanusia_phi.AAC.5
MCPGIFERQSNIIQDFSSASQVNGVIPGAAGFLRRKLRASSESDFRVHCKCQGLETRLPLRVHGHGYGHMSQPRAARVRSASAAQHLLGSSESECEGHSRPGPARIIIVLSDSTGFQASKFRVHRHRRYYYRSTSDGLTTLTVTTRVTVEPPIAGSYRT